MNEEKWLENSENLNDSFCGKMVSFEKYSNESALDVGRTAHALVWTSFE